MEFRPLFWVGVGILYVIGIVSGICSRSWEIIRVFKFPWKHTPQRDPCLPRQEISVILHGVRRPGGHPAASSCWAPCQNIKSESNLVIWALLSDQQMRGLDDHFPQWRAKGSIRWVWFAPTSHWPWCFLIEQTSNIFFWTCWCGECWVWTFEVDLPTGKQCHSRGVSFGLTRETKLARHGVINFHKKKPPAKAKSFNCFSILGWHIDVDIDLHMLHVGNIYLHFPMKVAIFHLSCR